MFYSRTSSRYSSRMDLSSRSISRISSRRHSVSSELGYKNMRNDQHLGTVTCSSNVILSKFLNERQALDTNTIGQRHLLADAAFIKSQYCRDGNRDSSPFVSNEVASSIISLTPSVISSPTGSKSFSPTGTPLNSPLRSPCITPPNEPVCSSAKGDQLSPDEPKNAYSSEGLVYSFFSSLKSALYGEQQKEAKTLIRKKHKKYKQKQFKRLGILEKVEEVGVENLFSNNNKPANTSSSNYYMSGSKTHRNLKFYGNGTNDGDDTSCCEDLEDIEPGSLTVGTRDSSGVPMYPENEVGQLMAPSFATSGRPSLNRDDLGRVPCAPKEASANPHTSRYNALGGGGTIGGRGPGRVIAPGEKRPTLQGALGVPGQPGTGALTGSLVRPDLGYVPSSSVREKPLGNGAGGDNYNQYPFQNVGDDGGFVGNLTSMFFGRKGGLF